MKPGIYEDVFFDEYLAWPYASNSSLSLMLKSPKHYKAGWTKEPTPAMRYGSLVHCGQLEPLAMAQRYAVMPEFHLDKENQTAKGEPTESKMTRYYRGKVAEFYRVNKEREIVTQEVFDKAIGLVQALAEDRLASDLLGGSGPVEVSLIWDDPETGIRCKGRIDKWQRTVRRFTDLKTTKYPPDFGKVIAARGYYRQAAFYQRGVSILTGEEHTPWIVAVDSDEPWASMTAPMSDDWLAFGRQEVDYALRRIKLATDCDEWPGYDSPAQWNPPGWFVPVGDEPAELVIGRRTIKV